MKLLAPSGHEWVDANDVEVLVLRRLFDERQVAFLSGQQGGSLIVFAGVCHHADDVALLLARLSGGSGGRRRSAAVAEEEVPEPREDGLQEKHDHVDGSEDDAAVEAHDGDAQDDKADLLGDRHLGVTSVAIVAGAAAAAGAGARGAGATALSAPLAAVHVHAAASVACAPARRRLVHVVQGEAALEPREHVDLLLQPVQVDAVTKGIVVVNFAPHRCLVVGEGDDSFLEAEEGAFVVFLAERALVELRLVVRVVGVARGVAHDVRVPAKEHGHEGHLGCRDLRRRDLGRCGASGREQRHQRRRARPKPTTPRHRHPSVRPLQRHDFFLSVRLRRERAQRK
mmetsp:Transcript_10931/g.28085  ORF Transcript_10931/g.28085 Transcript_10931/m.28085 type:complete len:341 (-) Transcript_10931:10-1032(-)